MGTQVIYTPGSLDNAPAIGAYTKHLHAFLTPGFTIKASFDSDSIFWFLFSSPFELFLNLR